MRDPDTGESRGFGFVSFDSFEASDAAIEAMNGQYLCNRAITVSYAIKKDSKTGERHGSAAGAPYTTCTSIILVGQQTHSFDVVVVFLLVYGYVRPQSACWPPTTPTVS